MCGIVGYIGNKNSVPILIDGLKRLEYRGYDYAGVGVISTNKLDVVKTEGKVSALEAMLQKSNLNSIVGIGHTRWATHGVPNTVNAHPHFNSDKSLLIIHNGIIENYSVLNESLER